MGLILIVDDSERDVERYERMAGSAGYDVVHCKEGGRACEILKEKTEGLVAAMVLWELAGTPSGAAVIAALRACRPALPVIAVTCSLDVGVAARAKALGARGCLLKPLDKKSLTAVVQEVCSPEEPLGPVFAGLRERLLGRSECFLNTLKKLARVIPESDARVLLIGESGTGKEPMARAVHELGSRAEEPLVAFNIAGVPETLLESHLFGHEQGAFTGAHKTTEGYLEQAGAGVLFLDEIGDLHLALQAKILRAIEEKTFRRVGGKEDIPFDARLVCATKLNLTHEVHEGRFREDLYYRISDVEIRIPPLRERGDDLLLLAEYFLKKLPEGKGRRLVRESVEILRSHPFRGNVRELEKVLQQAAVNARGTCIRPLDLPVEIMQETGGPSASSEAPEALKWPEKLLGMSHKDAMTCVEHEFDRWYLRERLKEAGGKVGRAAKLAGMDRKTFRRRWMECGLPPLSDRQQNEE